MVNYLWGTLAQMFGLPGEGQGVFGYVKWALIGITGTFWASYGMYIANFTSSPLLFAVTVLWAGDWIAGSLLAWKEHKYSTSRGKYSVLKLLLWWAALGASWTFLLNNYGFDDFVPYIVGATICWTEFLSILRNSAKYLGKNGNFLRRLADNLEGEVDIHFARWERSLSERRKKTPQPTVEGSDHQPDPPTRKPEPE